MSLALNDWGNHWWVTSSNCNWWVVWIIVPSSGESVWVYADLWHVEAWCNVWLPMLSKKQQAEGSSAVDSPCCRRLPGGGTPGLGCRGSGSETNWLYSICAGPWRVVFVMWSEWPKAILFPWENHIVEKPLPLSGLWDNYFVCFHDASSRWFCGLLCGHMGFFIFSTAESWGRGGNMVECCTGGSHMARNAESRAQCLRSCMSGHQMCKWL